MIWMKENIQSYSDKDLFRIYQTHESYRWKKHISTKKSKKNKCTSETLKLSFLLLKPCLETVWVVTAEEVLSGIRWVVVSDIAKRPAKPRTATFSCSGKEISGPTAKREK